MATSGTVSGAYKGYTLSVQWRIVSQDASANTSTIEVTPYLVCANTYDLYVGTKDLTYTVGGVVRERTAVAISTEGGETIRLDSPQTFTVTHNTNGSWSGTIMVAYYVNAFIGGKNTPVIIASGAVYLDTIPRASQPSLITWPETTNDVGNFGDTISIHMNRLSSDFTHTVRYEFGQQGGTIATNVGTGTTWTIPLSLMNLLPSSVKGSGRIYVDTYNGAEFIGTKYTGFTATVPASVKPTCSLSLDDVTNVDTIYGSPVQHLSKIKVTVTGTQAYKSPIDAYSISIDGVRYAEQTATSAALRTAGDSVVTVTVTDQRGRTGSASYTMKVQAYNPPAVTTLSVHRSNANGADNDQGEYIRVNFSAVLSSMSNKNTAAYVLRYKKPGDSIWTEVSLPALANQYTVDNYAYVFAADGNSSYEAEIDATDRHSTTTRSTSASTAFTLMNWGADGTSMGIGKMAEKADTLQIALDVEFLGKVTGTIFDALLPVNSVVIRYDHVNPGTLYPGTTWVRVYGAFPWFTDANGQIGLTGGERTVTLTADQIPAHNHGGTYTNAGTARTHAWLASGGSSMGYDTVNTGGGQAHNNMPPYIQVSAWRRTA